MALGENDPQPIEDSGEFSLISVRLGFFIFFLLFLPATCGGGSGGAMEEEIEREKRRFRKQRERESNGDKRLKPNVERERESQTCFFSWGLEIGCDGNKGE